MKISIKVNFKVKVIYLQSENNNSMIRTNPNPPMTRRDVIRFGITMRKALANDYTPRQRERIEATRAQMKLVGELIKRNNGGKDPILGF